MYVWSVTFARFPRLATSLLTLCPIMKTTLMISVLSTFVTMFVDHKRAVTMPKGIFDGIHFTSTQINGKCARCTNKFREDRENSNAKVASERETKSCTEKNASKCKANIYIQQIKNCPMASGIAIHSVVSSTNEWNMWSMRVVFLLFHSLFI